MYSAQRASKRSRLFPRTGPNQISFDNDLPTNRNRRCTTQITVTERVLAPVLGHRLVRLISTTRECLLRPTELEGLLADVGSFQPIPKPQPLG